MSLLGPSLIVQGRFGLPTRSASPLQVRRSILSGESVLDMSIQILMSGQVRTCARHVRSGELILVMSGQASLLNMTGQVNPC
jgi:hypothetical protein